MSKLVLNDIFRHIVPSVLYEDPQYKEFLYLLSIIFDDVKDLIDRFPELADVDNVEEIFLPKLAKLVGYRYRYNIDPDVQREIIKNMIHVYRDRGSDDSISMAATYGDDPNWIGGHLFTPGHNDNKLRAWVEHPVEKVFRFNISEFSGDHQLQDKSFYRAGTIIIHSGRWNDELRKAVRKVVPAGLKIYYMIDAESTVIVDFGEWLQVFDEYDIHYEIKVDRYTPDVLIHSNEYSKFSDTHLFSGSAEMLDDYCIHADTASTMYPMSHLLEHDKLASPDQAQVDAILHHGNHFLEYTKAYLTSDFPIIFSDDERPDSSIYPMSGGYLGEFYPKNIINMYNCLPSDVAYPVGSVDNQKPYDSYELFNRVLSEYDVHKDVIINVIMGASTFPMSKLLDIDYRPNINSGSQLDQIVNHSIPLYNSDIEHYSVRYLDAIMTSDLTPGFSSQYVFSGLPDGVEETFGNVDKLYSGATFLPYDQLSEEDKKAIHNEDSTDNLINHPNWLIYSELFSNNMTSNAAFGAYRFDDDSALSGPSVKEIIEFDEDTRTALIGATFLQYDKLSYLDKTTVFTEDLMNRSINHDLSYWTLQTESSWINMDGDAAFGSAKFSNNSQLSGYTDGEEVIIDDDDIDDQITVKMASTFLPYNQLTTPEKAAIISNDTIDLVLNHPYWNIDSIADIKDMSGIISLNYNKFSDNSGLSGPGDVITEIVGYDKDSRTATIGATFLPYSQLNNLEKSSIITEEIMNSIISHSHWLLDSFVYYNNINGNSSFNSNKFSDNAGFSSDSEPEIIGYDESTRTAISGTSFMPNESLSDTEKSSIITAEILDSQINHPNWNVDSNVFVNKMDGDASFGQFRLSSNSQLSGLQITTYDKELVLAQIGSSFYPFSQLLPVDKEVATSESLINQIINHNYDITIDSLLYYNNLNGNSSLGDTKFSDNSGLSGESVPEIINYDKNTRTAISGVAFLSDSQMTSNDRCTTPTESILDDLLSDRIQEISSRIDYNNMVGDASFGISKYSDNSGLSGYSDNSDIIINYNPITRTAIIGATFLPYSQLDELDKSVFMNSTILDRLLNHDKWDISSDIFINKLDEEYTMGTIKMDESSPISGIPN